MPTRVRSFSKINLGLAIGPPRPDGFHSLVTLYQTLALHDIVGISASRALRTRILLQSNDSRVPTDARNTAIRMVEKSLTRLDLQAEVEIHIQKNLPIQGGMGAGSANAAAALIGLEKELAIEVPDRLAIAAEVGSDVPLFLIGGAVLGSNRGERVEPVQDLQLNGDAEIHTVIALPRIGVSTPQAFRDWDERFAGPGTRPDLHSAPIRDTLKELSRAYASVLQEDIPENEIRAGASGILRDSSPGAQVHPTGQSQRDLAENSLLALVRTGIENDFETVVFQQFPPLRDIKRQLMGLDSGQPAIYAALSGSGSALFGLYPSETAAHAAQQRIRSMQIQYPGDSQELGVEAVVTKTLPRHLYWKSIFAE
jgi:4-diphosphocytidyl-2-C-methyl-D-erythritol kinase